MLGATANVSAAFLHDKPDCNIPIFLSLLLRDRLLPIAFNDLRSILNRQLDELKHFARANKGIKQNKHEQVKFVMSLLFL